MSRPRLGGWRSNTTFQVIVVLGDGNPTVDSEWGSFDAAQAEADKVHDDLAKAGYTQFFVGVIDEDNPENGWLTADD
jgi:hypothetical protein